MVNDFHCNAPCGRGNQSPNRSMGGGNVSFNPQATSTPEGNMSFAGAPQGNMSYAGAPPGNMSYAATPTRAGSPSRTTRVTRVEKTPTGTKRTTSETKLYSSTPTQTGQPANQTFHATPDYNYAPPYQAGPAMNETYDLGPAQMNLTYNAGPARADATYVVDDPNYSDFDASQDSYLQGMQDFMQDFSPLAHDASMGRRMQHLDRQENMEWNAANQEFQRRVNQAGLDDGFYDRQRRHLIEALRDLEMRYAMEREMAQQENAMDLSQISGNASMLGDEAPPALPGTPQQRRGAGVRRNLFGAPRGDSPPPGLANDPRAVRRPASPLAQPHMFEDNNMFGGRDSPPRGLAGNPGAVRRPATPGGQMQPMNQFAQPQMFEENDLFGAPRGRDLPPPGLAGNPRAVRRPGSPGDLMNESAPAQIFEESVVTEIFDETPPDDLFYTP